MSKAGMLRKLGRYLPPFARRAGRWLVHCYNYDPNASLSYSQEGEDLILSRLFGDRDSGFYVDVGAHHPRRFSNTYLFYRRGWRGMNIDAMPGSMDAFRKARPRDINLEIPVLRERAALSYYQFNEPALNGFSSELARERDGKNGYRIVSVVELEGLPLAEILARHLPDTHSRIDFLSVDVEGLDLEVLESNDWQKFRPRVVLVEIGGSSLSSITRDPICRYLSEQRYHIFAKAVLTVIFLSEEFMAERGISA